MTQAHPFSRQASQTKLLRLLALLETPMTRAELAESLHLSVRRAQSYLTAMMAETPRRIYISGWRLNNPGSPSAVYALGNLPDKRKPRPRSRAEVQRKYRSDPDVAIKDVARKRLARAKPRRDALTSAFFGAAG